MPFGSVVRRFRKEKRLKDIVLFSDPFVGAAAVIGCLLFGYLGKFRS